MSWIDLQSGEAMTQRLKQNLVNALSYCLFVGLLFYVWHHIKFHCRFDSHKGDMVAPASRAV